MVGRLARAFRWRHQPNFDTNLHHMVGFWIALPLALLSVTGVLIFFPGLMGGGEGERAPVARVPAGQPTALSVQPPAGGRRQEPPPLATTHLTMAQAIAASGITAAPYTVNWPTPTQASWRISAGGTERRTVAIDDATGATVVPPTGEGGPGGQRPLVRRLHHGTGMGLLFQTIIVLGGIAPAALGITGITMWLRTCRWRADAARKSNARRSASVSTAE